MLAAWQTLETDPARQAHIAAELAEAQQQAAQEEAARRAEQEAKDKAAVDAEHAAWEKELFERIKQRDQKQQRRAPEQVLERMILPSSGFAKNGDTPPTLAVGFCQVSKISFSIIGP